MVTWRETDNEQLLSSTRRFGTLCRDQRFISTTNSHISERVGMERCHIEAMVTGKSFFRCQLLQRSRIFASVQS